MWLVIDKTKGNINYKFDMVIAAKINQYVWSEKKICKKVYVLQYVWQEYLVNTSDSSVIADTHLGFLMYGSLIYILVKKYLPRSMCCFFILVESNLWIIFLMLLISTLCSVVLKHNSYSPYLTESRAWENRLKHLYQLCLLEQALSGLLVLLLYEFTHLYSALCITAWSCDLSCKEVWEHTESSGLENNRFMFRTQLLF
jgi:hypothetical protein